MGGNATSVRLLDLVILTTPHYCFSSFARAPLSVLISSHLFVVRVLRRCNGVA
jgi:hypothetical protein